MKFNLISQNGFCSVSGYLYPGLLGMVIYVAIVLSASAQVEDAIVVDRIVAVVNDEIITLFDLNQSFEPFARNIKALGYPPQKESETLFKVRSDLLNELVDAKLSDQEIKKHKLTITETEIDEAIERIKAARYSTDEDLRAGLAQQGLTMEDYRKELKEHLLRSKLVNLQVKSKIVITKENIQAYYDTHREKYGGEKKYQLWNIFLKTVPYADDSERHSALARMETILAKLRQGQSFESLAKDNFIATLGAQGGDLGLFLYNELSAQLQEMVAKMKVGQFSSILNMDNGYQIVYLKKVIETPARNLAEVENEIQNILYKELVDHKYQEWLEDLRQRSHIKIIN